MKKTVKFFLVAVLIATVNVIGYAQCSDYKTGLNLNPKFISELDKLALNSEFANSKYPLAQTPNGCGPNDWRWLLVPGGFFGLADFTPSCNCHDECYGTSDNRSRCDYYFYKSLEKVCLSAPYVNKDNCVKVAKIYYESVARNGDNPHKIARAIQLRYEAWVESVIQILGEYEFSGTNSNGSRYEPGRCRISLNKGKIIFDWNLGSHSWKGWGTLNTENEITIQFSGTFSGSGTYKINPNNSISGVWKASGSVVNGTEILARLN